MRIRHVFRSLLVACVVVLVGLAFVGCGDDDDMSSILDAEVAELAGSVRWSGSLVSEMDGLNWRQSDDGRIDFWDRSCCDPPDWSSSRSDPPYLEARIEQERRLEDDPFTVVHRLGVASAEGVKWVWASVLANSESVHPKSVAEGFVPPGEFRIVVDVLGIEDPSDSAEFLIDCTSTDTRPAVALALLDGQTSTIARAWLIDGGFQYLATSDVSCD